MAIQRQDRRQRRPRSWSPASRSRRPSSPRPPAAGWILVGLLPFFLVNQYRCVVATDRRLLVLDSGKLSSTKPKSVVRALPRSTRIGPFSGALWYVTGNLGETLRIHKRFQKDIEAADAAAGAAAPPPPPPPPPA